jgi:hypothetical protein
MKTPRRPAHQRRLARPHAIAAWPRPATAVWGPAPPSPPT